MAKKKRELTAFEKLAAKRGVDLKAERARATKQKLAGKPIGGTTRETLVKQRAQETFKRQREAAAKPTPTTPTITSEQAERIKAGTLKATAKTTAAVKAGTAIIKDPTGKEELKGLGLSAIAALSITPAGRGVKIGKGMIGQQAKADLDVLIGKGTPATQYFSNTKTIKLTKSWLTKLAAAARNPTTVVTALLAAIGSYPFTFFIREEALQIIKGTFTGAIINGNFEEAQIALDEREDILNPSLWDNIMAGIPIANTVKELFDLFQTSRIALVIDQKVMDGMKIQAETGETEDEKWKRLREEEAEQDKETVDYYNEQRKQQVRWEQEARKAANKAQSAAERKARNEDAAFWAKEKEKQREKEAEDRKAIADFWIAYRKAMLKITEDSRPSNLNFGLL